jgi:hypothetical protein
MAALIWVVYSGQYGNNSNNGDNMPKGMAFPSGTTMSSPQFVACNSV